MKCTVVSYSLSQDPSTLKEWKENLFKEIMSFIESGSEVILYPELFLIGVSQYFSGPEIRTASDFIHNELLPELGDILHDKKIFLVLGSGPRVDSGATYNSCPIFYNNKWHFQDKLFLTPWEIDFTAGSELKIFMVNGLKTAVTVCFDSEQPDLAARMKSECVHMVLVPSSTTDEKGNSRVNRCSSARAVELGAAVLTSPLIGGSKCEYVKHNEGRQGYFLPAQEDVSTLQEEFSKYSSDEKVVSHYNVDAGMLKRLKAHNSETKPFNKPLHPDLRLTNAE